MSSRYVIKNVLRFFPKQLKTVVECGPGDGVLTRAILKRLPSDGRLIAIENNPEFVKILNGFGDPRLQVIHGKAQEVILQLQKSGREGVDLVLASIPFWYLMPVERFQVMNDIYHVLAPKGVCVIFHQYRPLMYPVLKKIFGTASLFFELRNIPPCFIMYAKKSSHAIIHDFAREAL